MLYSYFDRIISLRAFSLTASFKTKENWIFLANQRFSGFYILLENFSKQTIMNSQIHKNSYRIHKNFRKSTNLIKKHKKLLFTGNGKKYFSLDILDIQEKLSSIHIKPQKVNKHEELSGLFFTNIIPNFSSSMKRKNEELFKLDSFVRPRQKFLWTFLRTFWFHWLEIKLIRFLFYFVV